ncbi:MAG: MazG family protein [SAR202 cluster bacterium]|nr:MazG family protein [SAR202 cluster bacterium]|tara:strand:+ start:1535 stop:2185 length:651 start_codon:yes stop_codon:yes gene_type:complete
MKSTNIQIEKNFIDLVNTVEKLRSDQGCPWDREQTSESLSQYILQETYEVLECIDNNNWEGLKDELGDLLFQILIQSLIREEKGEFKLSDVIKSINDKLIKRHPHVFKDKKNDINSEKVLENWGKMKKSESQNDQHYIKNITNTLPSLSFAYELYKKSLDVNIDLNKTKKYDNFSNEEITNILFELTSTAAKKNIDLENEFRKYIKAKQLDIIKKI